VEVILEVKEVILEGYNLTMEVILECLNKRVEVILERSFTIKRKQS